MTQPFTVADLYLHRKITELDAAPDGAAVACTVRSVDREQDDYVSCIWSIAPDGSSPPRQLTRGPGLDQSPRWSPQGDRLAFLSDRGGSQQVHLLPSSGGEAAPLGQLPGAVSDLRWTPDGRALVVTAAIAVDPDWRGARPQGRRPKERKVQPQVAWKLPYKSDGIGYTLARTHINSCDFSLNMWALDETPGDYDLHAFTLAPMRKWTLPLIHALSQLPDAEPLREAIRTGDRATTATLLARTDAVEYAKRTADDYASRARQELECLPGSECRAILHKLTEWATRREK